MAMRWRSLMAWGVLCLSSCQRAPVAASPGPPPPSASAPDGNDAGKGPDVSVTGKASTAPALLSSVPGHAGWSFAVRPTPCSDRPHGCPFEVEVVEGTRVLARAELDWARAFGEATLLPAAPFGGTGDPFQPGPLPAWSTGEESTEATTLARALALAPGVPGILVTQQAGFEHLKRAHFLFTLVGSRLTEVYRYEEPSGPTFSTTAILPLDPAHAAVLLIAGSSVSTEGDGAADIADVHLVRWDEGTRAVLDEPAGGRAHAVVFGPFPTVAQATASRIRHSKCFGAFWLLPSELFEGGGKPAFALAALGASEAGARELLRATQTCAKGIRGAVTTLRPPPPG